MASYSSPFFKSNCFSDYCDHFIRVTDLQIGGATGLFGRAQAHAPRPTPIDRPLSIISWEFNIASYLQVRGRFDVGEGKGG